MNLTGIMLFQSVFEQQQCPIIFNASEIVKYIKLLEATIISAFYFVYQNDDQMIQMQIQTLCKG